MKTIFRVLACTVTEQCSRGLVNPAPTAVYQSFHYANSIFSYTIPNLTPGAVYALRLHFAERDASRRGHPMTLFACSGAVLFTDLDVWAAAGGARNRAVI